MLNQNSLINNLISFIIIWFLLFENCKMDTKTSDMTTAIQVVNKSFTEEQLVKIEEEFHEYMDELIFYRYPSVLHLTWKEWKVIKPFFINSDYTRMVAFIPNWRIKNGKASTSMIWMTGFYAENKWHFFGQNETQYMDFIEGVNADFDPLKWETTKNEIESYTKSYIKYNSETQDWGINDDWFYRYFDTHDHLSSEDRDMYLENDLSEIPEEYWVNRYKLNTKIQEYKLQKTKQYWDKEDELYKQNKLTEKEWQVIQGRRNPKTDEDIINLQKFDKEVLRDVTDTTYVNLLNEADPGFKERLAKRNKKYGRQNDE